MAPQIPSYRLHKPSGQAVVTLSDTNTGRRRDVYLGAYGTSASRENTHSSSPVGRATAARWTAPTADPHHSPPRKPAQVSPNSFSRTGGT